MKKIVILCVLCSVNASFAAGFAKVLVLKGKASKLLPGKMKARPIHKGETLPEYTSIVTYGKSFLRVEFQDKSVVNLGANSKMVIASKKNKDGTVINFLKGVMRSQVDKKESSAQNKMLIKTRTAVMGIRGTKFIVSYNPVNKNTALVTVEGKVAMAKIDAQEAKSHSEKIKQSMPDEKVLEEKLALKEEVVEVKPGEFSGTTEETKEAFKPVKIAPKQFDALAKSVKSSLKADEVYIEQEEDSNADLKSGGFVDLKTAFYVPPKEDSQFDEKKGVYIASSEIGQVDRYGNYRAPKGTKLDPIKGFVAKAESTKVTSNDLNKNLKKKYQKVKAKERQSSEPSWLSRNLKRILPKNHLIRFFMGYHHESNTVGYSNFDGFATTKRGEARYRSNKGGQYGFSFIQEWTKKLSTSFNVSFFRYEMDMNSSRTNSEFTSYVGEGNVQLGFHYNPTSRLELSILLGEVEHYRPNICYGCVVSNVDRLEAFDEQKGVLEWQIVHYFFQLKNWELGYSANYAHFEGGRDGFDYKNANRYRLGIRGRKMISKTLKLTPYITHQYDHMDLVSYYNNGGAIGSDKIKMRRRSTDMGLQVTWDY